MRNVFPALLALMAFFTLSGEVISKGAEKQGISTNILLKEAESDPNYLALFVADRIEDIYSRPWMMAKAAAALARTGKREGVEDMLRSAALSTVGLEGTSYMENTLIGIAEGYVELEKYAKAMEIANKVKGAFPRVSILCKIAVKYDSKGRGEEASRILSEAAAGLEGAEKEARSNSLVEIAKTYSDISLYKEAVQTANKIDNLALKSEVLSTISLGYAKAGHKNNAMQVLSQVEKIAGMVPKELDSAACLADGAEKYAELGEKEKADQLLFQASAKISDIRSRFSKAAVLYNIALVYAKIGQLDEALDVAESINDDNYMPRAFAEIAVSLAEKGRKDESGELLARTIKMAEKGRIEHFKANVLMDAVRSYIKLSDCQTALKLAGNMKDDFNRPRALAEIGLKFSSMKNRRQAVRSFERAFFAAAAIENNYYLSWAVVDISALLGKAGLKPTGKMKEAFRQMIVKSARVGRREDVAEFKAEVIRTIKLPRGYHEGLLIEGDKIFVNNGKKGKTWVIGLEDGSVASVVEPAGTFSEGLTPAAEAGSYWLTDWDAKKIYKVKIADGKMTAEREVSLAPSRPTGAAWDGTRLYVLTWTENAGVVYHLLVADKDCGVMRKLRIKGIPEPSQLAWDGTDLWVSSWHDGFVYKISMNTMEVTGRFRSPAKDTTGIAWKGDRIYLTGTDSDLYEIKIKDKK